MLPLLFIPAVIGAAAIGRNLGEIIRANMDRKIEQRKEKGISIYKDCNIHNDYSTHITMNNYNNCTFSKYDNCTFNVFGNSDHEPDEILERMRRHR